MDSMLGGENDKQGTQTERLNIRGICRYKRSVPQILAEMLILEGCCLEGPRGVGVRAAGANYAYMKHDDW